jgi:hypothetical protein
MKSLYISESRKAMYEDNSIIIDDMIVTKNGVKIFHVKGRNGSKLEVPDI